MIGFSCVLFELKIIFLELFIWFYCCKVVCVLVGGGVVGLGYVLWSCTA